MYISTDEVYATAGISSSEIAVANVTEFILQAQGIVDRLTNTTYWTQETSGTATAGANTSLTDSGASWTVNGYANMYLWITSGTGSGQIRKISSNTATVITVDTAWDTNPDNTSVYRVSDTGTNPRVVSELRDGDDTDTLYTDKYPLILLETVTSNSTSVTPGSIYQYPARGKLVLNSDTEVSFWTSKKAQKNVLTYYYGVYPLPYDVKRYVVITASLSTLSAQMGGTFNVPSTYSLPEGSVTIGQAYVNIRGTFDVLTKEKDKIEERLIKYASFA